jgi:prepilin-type N-terminal cleavage/methylation domain-containing protein/prepilin-type processing-associated H-X9-DG protein
MSKQRYLGIRHAFTLIELLVVVAIIALLIAILIPSLSEARQSAYRVSCLSNMKSVGTSAAIYAAANNDTLIMPPSSGQTYNATSGLAYGMLNSNAQLDYSQGPFFEILSGSADGRRKLMNCPSEINDDSRPVSTMGNQTMQPRNFSYSWNRMLKESINGDGPVRKASRIDTPAHKILLFEEVSPNDGLCSMEGNSFGEDRPAFRHAKGANFGFVDGHSEYVTPVQLGFSRPTDTDTYAKNVTLDHPETLASFTHLVGTRF